MKVWTTKYVLTRGIEEHEVEQEKLSTRVYTKDKFIKHFTLGVDAFTTHSHAIEAAYKLKGKAILSLNRKISRLQELEFKEPLETRKAWIKKDLDKLPIAEKQGNIWVRGGRVI